MTENATGEDEKIGALADFVMRDIKPQETDSPDHTFFPFQASTVLHNRYGDCKDKSALLIALLAAEGIHADLALLISRSLGITPNLPSMRFDHAVAYIHTAHGPLWIDTNLDPKVYLCGDLPIDDAETPALIVNDATTDLTMTPKSPIEHNITTYELSLKLHKDGQLTGRLDFYVTGEANLRNREDLANATPEQNLLALFRLVNGSFKNVSYDGGAFEGLTAPHNSLKATVKFHIDDFIYHQGDALWLSLPGPCRFEGFAPRKTDAEIPERYGRFITSIHMELPDGYTVQPFPEANATSPWGEYHVSAKQEGNKLEVCWDFSHTALRVPVAEIAKYSAFLKDLNQINKSMLLTKPAATQPVLTPSNLTMAPNDRGR